jgi:Glycosyltransferase family 9 (heptosyltransferase)
VSEKSPPNLPNWMPTFSRLTGMVWAAKVALAAGGLPSIGIFCNGGLGDDLMCTVVAHELKKRGAGKVWLFTAFPELVSGNPDLTAVPTDFRLRRLCGLFRVPCIEVGYPGNPPRHVTTMMCEAAGVRGGIELRPHLTLSPEEERAGRLTARPQIALQTSNLAARFPIRNKLWHPERMQVVADALKGDFDLIQLGAPSDPQLHGALDLRGKTSVRQAAAVLAQSRLFIGLTTGLMHLARAVECRSVIVYGGREHPRQSGYSANENIHWEGPCAPCWERDACDFDRRCMREIQPGPVLAAARRQLDRYGTPLIIDRAETAA